MYYIYMDEAGTSAKEPVTVVVGIIVHADQSWRRAAKEVEHTLDTFVPSQLRPAFTFHAKSIWANPKYREGWSEEERAAFIGAMAAIPRKLGLAICIGKVRRDCLLKPRDDVAIMASDIHHLFAFAICAARANKYVRDWSDPDEVATIVSEDVPNKRRLIKKIVANGGIYKKHLIERKHIRETEQEKSSGMIIQNSPGEIDRVIDTVHFVEKSEAPLIQIADACAFSFRRYFARQMNGDRWVEEMLGGPLVWADWQGPSSDVTFSFNPAHSYPGAMLPQRPQCAGPGT